MANNTPGGNITIFVGKDGEEFLVSRVALLRINQECDGTDPPATLTLLPGLQDQSIAYFTLKTVKPEIFKCVEQYAHIRDYTTPPYKWRRLGGGGENERAPLKNSLFKVGCQEGKTPCGHQYSNLLLGNSFFFTGYDTYPISNDEISRRIRGWMPPAAHVVVANDSVRTLSQVLEMHARIHVFASFLRIEGLKDISIYKLFRTVMSMQNTRENAEALEIVVRIAYEESNHIDGGMLRELVSEFVAVNWSITSQCDSFENLFDEIPEFTKDCLRVMAQYRPKD